MLSAAFFWIYWWVQIPVGWLAERYRGSSRALGGVCGVGDGDCVLRAWPSSFVMLIGLRMMLGLGESVGFPTVSKLVAAVVPVAKLGKANGIVGLGYLMAPGVGIFMARFLIDEVGWRGMFLTFGIALVALDVPWAMVKLPKIATAPSDAETPTWSMILRQRALWGTSLGLCCSNYLWYFILSWLPSYLVDERGFSMHKMEHLSMLGLFRQRVQRARHRLEHRSLHRARPRVGELRLQVSDGDRAPGLGAVHARDGIRLRDRRHRRHVRLSVPDGRFLARHVCDVADSRRAARLRPLGGYSECAREFLGTDLDLDHGFIVQRTGHFALAFLAAPS